VSAMEESLRGMKHARVLVVGDVMLDEYRRGHVERISPEAPVPILTVVGRETTLGGAGNVVKNLRSLNVNVQVIGVVGEDETGDEILAELEQSGADGSGIVKDPRRMSTRKIRYVSLEHGQQVFRADEESRHAVNGSVEAEIMRQVHEKTGWAQVILCSDYLKGMLSEGVLRAVFAAGREGKAPVIVAPKDSKARRYEGATILMPNLKEFSRIVGSAADGNGWLTESARSLTESMGLEALLVTRGREGMTLFESRSDGFRRVDIPVVARNVYDVTGAGDTAIAVFAAAIASGAGLEGAARLANIAAGIVVGKHGTATTTIEEIRNHLTEQEPQVERTSVILPPLQSEAAKP
jgi:D-beta-D-heptose 7-phosphate kinase / D-beta-D-heptose 1-phosphate adenosyltransferase